MNYVLSFNGVDALWGSAQEWYGQPIGAVLVIVWDDNDEWPRCAC